MRKQVPKLIECGDHDFAPCALTCVHICEGTATAVVPIQREEGCEVENDWMCPQCYKKYFLSEHDDDPGIDDLRAVCIHCLRKILKPYEKNRESNSMSAKMKVSIAPRDNKEDTVLDSLGYKLGPENANGVNSRWIGCDPSLVPMLLRDLCRAGMTLATIECDMAGLTEEDLREIDEKLICGVLGKTQ